MDIKHLSTPTHSCTPEKIWCAAVRYSDQVVRGPNHAYCIQVLCEMYGPGTFDRVRQDQQGFLTTTGRFVDRQIAYHIAEQAGQLLQPSWGEVLYSENCKYAEVPQHATLEEKQQSAQ